MRTTIVFDSEITNETINALINDIVSFDGEVDLFFATNGGTNIETTAFIHFLNNQCKDKVRMFFTGSVASNGVNILMNFEGEKYITEDLYYILIHKSAGNITSSRGDKYIDEIRKQFQIDNKNQLKKYTAFYKLTKEEKKNYNKGEDIILYKDDFKRFADKITTYKQ